MSIVKDLLFIVILLILFFVLKKNVSLKEELFNQRENYIKTLSHDIKVSTLAQIRGLDLLNKNYDKELVIDVKDSCAYSLDMINMLLNTYRYENGEQVLNCEFLNLSDLISSTFSKFNSLMQEKMIKFYSDENSCGTIWADKIEIEKLLYYLFSTAIFYAAKSSTIVISSKNNKNNLEISIIYAGKSLSEEECKRMFSNNPRFSTVGHGIKMYMCKKIIEFHGGKIKVENITKNINSFTFTLPEKNNCNIAKTALLSKLQPFNL